MLFLGGMCPVSLLLAHFFFSKMTKSEFSSNTYEYVVYHNFFICSNSISHAAHATNLEANWENIYSVHSFIHYRTVLEEMTSWQL